ncbi:MAG: tetratricopeptide repeat protein [Candidatus Sericytochromatia bacterium]|nr:tetratricopeptide repeat protein [Candidatus Sericytochromatia bacterium]
MFNKYLKTILNGGIPEQEIRPREDGLAAYEAGEFQRAHPLLLKALETDPFAVDVLLALGRIDMSSEQFEKAEAWLKRAHDVDVRHALVNYLLGELAVRQERLPEAAGYFTRAVQSDPDYTDAYIRLGMVHQQAQRGDEAIKAFERAIFLDRSAVVARFHLAEVCVAQGDVRRALTQLHLVKEIHGDYPPIFVLQGEIQFGLGDFRQAVLEFERAIALGIDHADIQAHLSQAHAHLGNREAALQAALRSLEHDPARHALRLQVAEWLEQTHRLAQARAHYASLAETEPHAAHAQEALLRLDERLAQIAASMAGNDDAEGLH